MKLYNLYEEVILEEIETKSQIITEGVSKDAVIAAINGKYNVNITYQDYVGQPPSKRYIQVYNVGMTKSGNLAIRAYQIFGGSKTTPSSGAWKIFLLDKIEGWYPTNKKWSNPVSDLDASIPAYNQMGDKKFSQVDAKVDPNTFTRKRSDINQKTNLEKITPNELNK